MVRGALPGLLALCAACITQRSWSYTAEAPRQRLPVLDRSVAVVPAADHRSRDNTDHAMLAMLPFVPYGSQDLDRPEQLDLHITTSRWQIQPGEDIARAVAAELQSSGLFRAAFFTPHASDGDLVLAVTIDRLHAEGKVISYCLSFTGVYLWLLLPAFTADNDLALDFDLRDRSGRSLWSGHFERHYESGLCWIYSPPDEFMYASLLKDMLLHDVLPALEQLPAAR